MAGEWKPDPAGKHELRYHDGDRWTEHVSNQGTSSTDPLKGPQPLAAPPVPQPSLDPLYGASTTVPPARSGMSGRKVAALVAACSLVALLIGVGIGGAGSQDKTDVVAAKDQATTSTLTPEQQAAATAAQEAAAAQAAAEKAEADKAAADKAAADQAAAQKVAADQAAAAKAAADKAAADKAAADKAAADRAAAQAAAERAAAAPRTFSGVGGKVTGKFTLARGGYKVEWRATGPRGNFIVQIHDSAGNSYPSIVNEIPPDPSSGEGFFKSPGGEFYLEAESSQFTWTVTLTKV